MFNFATNKHLSETFRYTLYVFAAILIILLAATFNFFIREQEMQAKEKEFRSQIEQAKRFLKMQ